MSTPHAFKVGDEATHTRWTDADAGHIVAVSPNGKTVTLQYAKQKLLNGPSSGEPDALVQTPGGFAAHTSGRQRWSVEADPNGAKQKFTLRKDGRWKTAGSGNGPGDTLSPGAHPHYDYNF